MLLWSPEITTITFLKSDITHIQQKKIISLSIDAQQRGTFSYVLNFHFFCSFLRTLFARVEVASSEHRHKSRDWKILFFNLISNLFYQKGFCAVSDPSGDFLFSNAAGGTLRNPFAEFPSPPGTSYFLILKLFAVSIRGSCFRPLWGLLIF